MKAEILEIDGSWRRVADCANVTVGREDGTKEPSSLWKKKLIASEQSRIRVMFVYAQFSDIPSWRSTQMSRHHVGVEKFITTQRTDRTGKDRNEIPQGALVNMKYHLNLQAIINISKKRYCNNASPEATELWAMFLIELFKIIPEMADFCLPECEYRNGVCYEFFSPCGRYPLKQIDD